MPNRECCGYAVLVLFSTMVEQIRTNRKVTQRASQEE